MAKILVAEDELALNELMVWNLELVGHEVKSCFDGDEALICLQKDSYDLILLDVMLPGISGFEIKEKIDKEQPVIFVTARTSLQNRLHGLKLGADDYITKPFEMLELVARVEAVLRRTHKQEKMFMLDGITVYMDARTVYRNKKEKVELTPKEFDLLEVLILNRNLALTREKLLDLVWEYDYEGDTRTVDVHIQRLRKKLRWEKQMQTVFKYGYRLQVQR